MADASYPSCCLMFLELATTYDNVYPKKHRWHMIAEYDKWLKWVVFVMIVPATAPFWGVNSYVYHFSSRRSEMNFEDGHAWCSHWLQRYDRTEHSTQICRHGDRFILGRGGEFYSLFCLAANADLNRRLVLSLGWSNLLISSERLTTKVGNSLREAILLIKDD